MILIIVITVTVIAAVDVIIIVIDILPLVWFILFIYQQLGHPQGLCLSKYVLLAQRYPLA